MAASVMHDTPSQQHGTTGYHIHFLIRTRYHNIISFAIRHHFVVKLLLVAVGDGVPRNTLSCHCIHMLVYGTLLCLLLWLLVPSQCEAVNMRLRAIACMFLHGKRPCFPYYFCFCLCVVSVFVSFADSKHLVFSW